MSGEVGDASPRRDPAEPTSAWWLRWSLDAPLVAVGWLLLARRCGATIDGAAPWVLGTSTWLVYSADRWLDGRRLGLAAWPSSGQAARPRHRIESGRRTLMPFLWLWMLAVDLWLARTLPAETLLRGAFVLALTSGYLLLVHLPSARSWVPKEFLVAVVFTSGVMLFVERPLGPWALEAAGLLVICWLNCQVVAWWDRDYDLSTGQATWLGGLATRPALVVVGMALMPVFALMTFLGQLHVLWAAALSAAALGLVALLQLGHGGRGRAWVDLVLAAPAWLLAIDLRVVG